MLEEIIPAITPSNITDIQLLKDSLDIFLEYLVENSDIAIDIKNILNTKNIPIYEEFVKIYLNNIYTVLSKTEHNEKLYLKLKNIYAAYGYDIDSEDLTIDILSLLQEDYIVTHKNYKMSKGTSKGMEYIYNIIIRSGIQKEFGDDNAGQFRYFETGRLFEYGIEGTMIDELYEQYVKTLTHPVGWAYFYQRVFYLSFVDYFDIEFVYDFRAMEVRCQNGDTLTSEDYLERYKDKVEFISTEYVGPVNAQSKLITVYFTTGEKFVSNSDPRSLIFYGNDGVVSYDEGLGNCGLYMDYDVTIVTKVKDQMTFEWTMPEASTTGKLNSIGAGNTFVGNFIVGEKLVNPNVGVTYGTWVGEVQDISSDPRFDGTTSTSEYAIGAIKGATAVDEYEWHQELVIVPNVNMTFEDTVKKDTRWDTRGLRWDDFTFDSEYISDSFEIEAISL